MPPGMASPRSSELASPPSGAASIDPPESRLDLSAHSERSYVPLRFPIPLEVVLPNPRSIATYARVSSDEQRDRHTVLNQRSALSRRLSSEP